MPSDKPNTLRPIALLTLVRWRVLTRGRLRLVPQWSTGGDAERCAHDPLASRPPPPRSRDVTGYQTEHLAPLLQGGERRPLAHANWYVCRALISHCGSALSRAKSARSQEAANGGFAGSITGARPGATLTWVAPLLLCARSGSAGAKRIPHAPLPLAGRAFVRNQRKPWQRLGRVAMRRGGLLSRSGSYGPISRQINVRGAPPHPAAIRFRGTMRSDQ